MFNVSKLTDQQKEQIAQWASEGDQLNDLQKKMNSEFGAGITYMDTRFAIMDLGIELVVEEPEVEELPALPDHSDLPYNGYVDAKVDTIVKPGFIASGKVVFSDGIRAIWGIDEEGKLSMDADEPGYQIGDEDMISFQEVLRDRLKAN